MTTTARETRHQRRRREANERDAAARQEVLAALTRLELGADDCVVIRLGDRYFENPVLGRMVQRVGQQIGEVTGRPVFLLRHDQEMTAEPAPSPRLAAQSARMREPIF